MSAELKNCPFCGGEAGIADTMPEGAYWCYCWECAAEGSGRPTEAKAVAAWNSRTALDAAEARDVGVKPLVWHEDPDNDGDSCFWRAKAGDYIYEVGADLSYWWQLDGDISTCAINGFKTPDLAKAAAQADYTARILSALHPASPLGAVTEGPQPRELKTCKGCCHFKSEYWREPSGDGETYDSGTSADCLKAGRSISTYHGSEPAPPDWCPVVALAPFARKGE